MTEKLIEVERVYHSPDLGKPPRFAVCYRSLAGGQWNIHLAVEAAAAAMAPVRKRHADYWSILK